MKIGSTQEMEVTKNKSSSTKNQGLSLLNSHWQTLNIIKYILMTMEMVNTLITQT
jgi:hypothetical protein